MMQPELTREERLRYARQVVLPEVGEAGQRKLKSAKVLLVGAGGLGAPAALYLAAAGVGRLGLVDFDAVDLTNLHRQILYGTRDVGRPKLEAARETLERINPNVVVETYPEPLTADNAKRIVAPYDLVLDGADNFPTRYLVNDVCILLGKPNVHGSIFRFEGQTTVFGAPGGPCYRCLYPQPPTPDLVPNCAEAGVLGALPGVIGLIQATEALKIILGIGRPLVGRLLLYDALGMSFQELKIHRDPKCPLCGDRPSQTDLVDYNRFCEMPHPTISELEPLQLKAMMDGSEDFTLIDVREPEEFAGSRIPGSILIPLNELEFRLDELNPSATIVVHCHSGMRSARACQFLTLRGFKNVTNLKGGISEWAQQVSTP
jgi:molybdopterin/thiamine biosynthesis adenylyltransferase/rhodanese-related sulfurtransferase